MLNQECSNTPGRHPTGLLLPPTSSFSTGYGPRVLTTTSTSSSSSSRRLLLPSQTTTSTSSRSYKNLIQGCHTSRHLSYVCYHNTFVILQDCHIAIAKSYLVIPKVIIPRVIILGVSYFEKNFFYIFNTLSRIQVCTRKRLFRPEYRL